MTVGPSAATVCQAVADTLRLWLPSVHAEVAALSGVALTVPAEVRQLTDPKALQAAAMPSMSVSSPGLARPPRQSARGRLDLTWDVRVVVVDRGADYDDTTARAQWHAHAVYTALLQHPSLGGVAQSLLMAGTAFSEAAARDNRTVGACMSVFHVGVGSAVSEWTAPLLPPAAGQPDPAPAAVLSMPVTVAREA